MTEGKKIAEDIARELLSVQPMDSNVLSDLYKASKSREELIKEGYKPVSRMGLLWVKDE